MVNPLSSKTSKYHPPAPFVEKEGVNRLTRKADSQAFKDTYTTTSPLSSKPLPQGVRFGQDEKAKPTGKSRAFAEKAWVHFKEAAWKSYRLMEEAINSLVNIGCRMALMSTFILPMPKFMYNFIERQTFYSPIKSCSLELLEDEALADQIIEYKIPMKNGGGKRLNIAAWHIPTPEGSNKPTILFSHGRHSNMSHLKHYLKAFSDAGYGIMAYDYPGFGNSTGKVTLENCYNSGLEVSKHLSERLKVGLEKQVFFGYSLGTHITSHMAATISQNANNEFGGQKPKGVILLNSFPKLSDGVAFQKKRIAKRKLWFLPESWALRGLNYCFDTRKMREDLHTQRNLEKATDLNTLVISATADKELDFKDAEAMTQTLKEEKGHGNIHFEKLENAPHSLKEKDCQEMLRLVVKHLKKWA